MRYLAAGAVFGAGMLVRAAFAIYALPLAVLILWQQHVRRRGRAVRLGAFAVGATPFVAILLWHNALRFDDPLRFGYGGEGFTTPPWEGILGLLFSPGKSVFLYAPPLLLSSVLWPRFRRSYPALGLFLALAWGAALAFYGTWWAWHGGWTWGPRLLVPLIPLSCLPLGMVPERRSWRVVAGALVVLGVGVQLLGVLTDVTPHYREVVGADESRVRLVNFAPRYAPLVGAARRLLRGQTEPLAVFHLKGMGLPPTWSIGVPLLLILGAALAARRIARYRGRGEIR
jgi:hypothetical protein